MAPKIAWLISPICILSIPVMAQDESIALFFATLVVALIIRTRYELAGLVSGIGVVAAKIFFLVVAAAVSLGPRDKSYVTLLKRIVPICVPIMVIYAWSFHMWSDSGVNPLKTSFITVNSTSIWGLLYKTLQIEPETAAPLSKITALLFGLLPLGIAIARKTPLDPTGVLTLCAAMLSWVLSWYLHIQPEYLLILVPFVLAVPSPKVLTYVSTVGILSLPWVANIAYALWIWQGDDSIKGRLADAAAAFSPIGLSTMHTLALIASAAGMFSLSVYLTVSIWKYKSDG